MAWGESGAWLAGETNDNLYQQLLDDAEVALALDLEGRRRGRLRYHGAVVRRAASDSRRRRVVVRDASCIIGAHQLSFQFSLARPPLLMDDGRRQHGHVVVFCVTVAPAPPE